MVFKMMVILTIWFFFYLWFPSPLTPFVRNKPHLPKVFVQQSSLSSSQFSFWSTKLVVSNICNFQTKILLYMMNCFVSSDRSSYSDDLLYYSYSIGPLLHCSIGPLDHWSIGLLVHWSSILLAHWSLNHVKFQKSIRLNICRSVPP